MTVKFNVVARGKPGDKVTQRDVAKMSVEVSTISPADTAAGDSTETAVHAASVTNICRASRPGNGSRRRWTPLSPRRHK